MVNIYRNIYRLNVDFETSKLRLDDVKCIPKLILKVEMDQLLSMKIDEAAKCLLAARFYFELNSIPKRRDGKYVATDNVLCLILCSDPFFKDLFSKSKGSLRLFVND